MVAMNDSTRRLIMMMTIILAGTAVTFLELNPLIVFIISLAIGVVMLFGLNILAFDELKEDLSLFRERLNQPISIKKTKEEKAEKKTAEVKETGPKAGEESKKREIPFSGLIGRMPFKREKKEKGIEKNDTTAEKTSFLAGLAGKIKSRESSDDKTKKIDELLDKTINESVVSPEEAEDVPAGAGEEVGEDDFSDFDDLDLGLEDEDSDIEFEDEEIAVEPGAGGGTPASATGAEEEIPDSTIAEILAKEGIDFDLDSDNEFPEPAGDEEETGAEAEGGGGLGGLDELDDDVSGLDLEEDEIDEFDEIDLDEIEPEEEIDFEEEDEDEIELGDSEEEEQDVVVAPPEESDDIFSAPPKEWTQTSQVPGQDEFTSEEPSLALSFGGGGDEDDLFAMLKSDTKKAVVVQELSLVRGMKDLEVGSGELVEGLESVLNHLGVKVEKIEEEEDSKPETITEDENGVQ